jgi:hypothetical protein
MNDNVQEAADQQAKQADNGNKEVWVGQEHGGNCEHGYGL